MYTSLIENTDNLIKCFWLFYLKNISVFLKYGVVFTIYVKKTPLYSTYNITILVYKFKILDILLFIYKTS